MLRPKFSADFSLVGDSDVRVTCRLSACRQTVFDALCQQQAIVQWWGPRNYRVSVDLIDFEPGGLWRFVCRDDHGQTRIFHGEYREIITGQKIVRTFEYEDTMGQVLTESTELQSDGTETILTTTLSFPSEAARAAMVELGGKRGAVDSILRLEEFLARQLTPCPFTITRHFAARRDNVFAAWTTADAFASWFGPKGSSVQIAHFEAREDGYALSCVTLPGGPPMWGRCDYRYVRAPDTIVYVDAFSNADGGLTRHPISDSWPLELLTTVHFEAIANETNITLEWVPLHATPEEIATFDHAIDSMQGGWGGTFDQLQAFLRAQSAP